MLINVYVRVNEVESRNMCCCFLNRLKFKMADKMQFRMNIICLIHAYLYVHGLIGGAKYAN